MVKSKLKVPLTISSYTPSNQGKNPILKVKSFIGMSFDCLNIFGIKIWIFQKAFSQKRPKEFPWAFFGKTHFEKFKFLVRKYLDLKKYLENSILDNFCFMHQIDFSTPFQVTELWKSYIFRLNIFCLIIFRKFQSSITQKELKNQFGAENKSCPELNFTSTKVLQIFFEV